MFLSRWCSRLSRLSNTQAVPGSNPGRDTFYFTHALKCEARPQEMLSTKTEPFASSLRFLLATDIHLGFAEKDPVRGNDSFETFGEVLKLAHLHKVDALLLAGDLFHENRPSRRCMHKAMHLLRTYVFGDGEVQIECLSDGALNFGPHVSCANFENENLNIRLPIFSIHGNHDDPTGDGNLSAMDLLAEAGLVNYFGRTGSVEEVRMSPVLIRKGGVGVALYGLGAVRDERLHKAFLSRRVRMQLPTEEDTAQASLTSPWFNLLLFHQNRSPGSSSYIPETFLDDSLDLVIWGHEHECRIEPEVVPGRRFQVSQPGSTIATSLAVGEGARRKCAGLLEIRSKERFKMTAIELRSVRPLVLRDVSLAGCKTESDMMTLLSAAMERALLVEDSGKLPLVRLRVEVNELAKGLHVQRFGQSYIGRVANPRDLLLIQRPTRSKAKKQTDTNAPEDELLVQQSVEELVQACLGQSRLGLLPRNELGDCLRVFVEKDDRGEALESFLKSSLERTCKDVLTTDGLNLVIISDESVLKNEIERVRRRREEEWSRLNESKNIVMPTSTTLSSTAANSNVLSSTTKKEDSLNFSSPEKTQVVLPVKRGRKPAASQVNSKWTPLALAKK